MQRFLQFRLGSHTVPIVVGRFAGGQHAARANRVCTHCGGVAVAIDLHVMFECPLAQQYPPLFSTKTNIVLTGIILFFAARSHAGILSCLDFIHVTFVFFYM